jgi:hypothetical protein
VVSIYASWRGLDCEHEDGCKYWVESGDCVFEPGDPDDCTCGLPLAPLLYQGSHVLPSDDDPKGGCIEIASIPDHITREGRDDAPEGALKDWLRFGVYTAEDDVTLVLTRRHVEFLRDQLTGWLERGNE